MRKSFWIVSVSVLILLGLVLVAIALWPKPTSPAGETRVSVSGGAYTDVTPGRLADMLKRKDFIFINTHIPYEGELEQTDAFIPFEENGPQQLREYPTDKNAKIILYCRSGRMSTIVASELAQAGYTNVWNLDGGMKAWEQAGFELIQK